MTRAEIEALLEELAAASRYLLASGLRIREAAEHMVAVNDQLQEAVTRIDHAVTAGLSHLHGDDEERE